ncbi:MAG: hypothetical protein H8E29_15020 [Anaerolineales bacterium]|uniref:Uncharacterized protein n=1 Tax=Candidatus Desulfolinea nitratireducens TaxID=2841698 RepID=A0A8J6NMJ2_9CHLR|nr:hypothetical protein [Candidatus Desulfolinea nitratireducens]
MKLTLVRWIIFNIFLFAFGIGLGAAHYPVDFDGLRCPAYEGNTLAECFQFGAFLGTISGLVIGIGQGVFLRKQLSWSRNQILAWVAATTAAFALGHAIGDSGPVPQALPWSALGLGLVSGLILGILQWLALRGKIENASRWVWSSTIGFGIGLGVVGIAAAVLLDANRNSIFHWHTLFDLLLFIALDGLFVGGIWAALTGRVLFTRQAQ